MGPVGGGRRGRGHRSKSKHSRNGGGSKGGRETKGCPNNNTCAAQLCRVKKITTRENARPPNEPVVPYVTKQLLPRSLNPSTSPLCPPFLGNPPCDADLGSGVVYHSYMFFYIDIAFRIDMKAEKSTVCSILTRPPLPSPPRLVFCCRHSRGGFVRCRLLGSIGDRHFDNYYAIEKGGRRGNEIVRTRVTPLSSSSAGSEACHLPVMCVHCTARERSRKSDDRSMFHPIFRNMAFCTVKWYLQYTVYTLYENGKNDSISLVLFFSDRRLPPRSSLFWLRKHHHIASVRPHAVGRS